MNFPIFISMVLLGGITMPQAVFGLTTTNNVEWDYLKLVRTWPPAFCFEDEKRDECRVLKHLKGWVIHGLWPTKTHGEGPNDCNTSWTFDVRKVQMLRPKLDYNWPALLRDESLIETWKYEWVKHGTCGKSLPALNGQTKYFNVTLTKHLAINLSELLSKGGIEPSESRSYKRKDVLDILKKSLGFDTTIYCLESERDKRVYLEEVEICLNKSFKLVNCPPASKLIAARTPPAFSPASSLPAQQRFRSGPCWDDPIYYKPFP